VFPLALSLWIFITLFNLAGRFNNFIKKLTPQGRPYSIINFMVVVELVRILIRPITLSIRLVSNIVAGHLLISILVNFLISSGYNRLFTLVVVINLLEIGVSIIQGYVFAMLLFMYHSD
jgi:F-type H+-transporting ATPase subunit a